APERAPRLITTTAQRLRRLDAAGVETVLLVPFSLDFARLTPAEFADQVLHRTLDARVVMVGEDFRFGHKQSGDLETLRALGQQFGFTVEAIHDIHAGTRSSGLRISSTGIRTLIAQGNVSRACRLMGTPFALEGPVVSGHGIGRTQTVPTLNLAAENELLPRNGVYITRTRFEPNGVPVPSITNVGVRPTFQGTSLSVETFLLTEGPVETPARIEVEFLSWVRDEKKFATPEALKARIFRDVKSARRFHAKFPPTLAKTRVG
ncbi:MAG TPA: riboflavin kinase, partial [Bryobacteraceae bacterium]|nr:riboflavin kinase [Bryobacteraceae bacterium]